MSNKFFAILCILAAFLIIPVDHSVIFLLREIDNPWAWAFAQLAVGFAGFACVWFGLQRSELQGCAMGFLGAHLMFTGFFELGFFLFSEIMDLQPLVDPATGEVLLPPSLQVNEASLLILLPLFLLLYADREVRCHMILWLRKHFRMQTEPALKSAEERSYARIVASETLFVIWMIYGISIVTLDPRLLGPGHWLSTTIYVWFLIWPLYLIYRITKIENRGEIMRYSIPIGVLLWTWVEGLAAAGMVSEYYVRPVEFPVASALTALVAAGLLGVVYRDDLTRS